MSQSDDAINCPPPRNNWSVFIPAMLLVITVGIGMILWPEQGAIAAESARNFVTGTLGWLYLSLGIAALIFAAWLAFGPYGKVLLGQPGEAPEYSDLHWIAMMFTAGIGGSLIAWGLVEPIFYLQTPPLGITPHSPESMEWAHAYPLFHWGIIPWAIYAIPAVPVAYLLFVKNSSVMNISAICEEALPKHGRKVTRGVIDVIIVLGIVGGTATSLGLGVPLVSALFSELLGLTDTLMLKLIVLAIWVSLFGASAYRGLKKGIQVLADINMMLVFITLLFILLVGPTLFILTMSVNSIGLMAENFIRMATWMDPINKGGFPEAWTIFYWAWWIAFAPFVGLFVGRISRGRTIRQLIVGVVGWGSLGTITFLLIMGGYSIFLESSGQLPLSEMLANDGMAKVTAKAIAHLPFGNFALIIFIVLSIIFYATSFDSSSYTVASICSKDLHNNQEPLRSSRLVWAAALALMAMGLIISNDFRIVQASTVVFSLPLLPVLVLMCVNTVKWLRRDFGAGGK